MDKEIQDLIDKFRIRYGSQTPIKEIQEMELFKQELKKIQDKYK